VAGRSASWFTVPAGSPLFKVGEPANSIYFVLSGQLGTFREHAGGEHELISIIRAGEPVGEMALFSTTSDGKPAKHSHSVYAMRDTEMLRISRAGFDRLIKAEPEILQRLMRAVLIRLRQGGRRSQRAEPKVFSFVATSPTINLDLRTEMLEAALLEMGMRVRIVRAHEGADKPTAYFHEIEEENDIVILLSEIGDTDWHRLAMRQADRVWVFGRCDAVPSDPLFPEDTSPARQFKLVDVVMIRHQCARMTASPHKWKSACNGKRILHWDDKDADDCQRLARVIAGRSVGLVMSGGGARAFAHIGVVRAMRERGLPIDFVGGTSMGAVVAACVAMGWDDDEIDRRIRKAFVETNPLGDYTLPVVGLVKGHRVNRRLKEHFGDAVIDDVELPFFAVSTDLTNGTCRIHRDGRIDEALRASISLPGILPPVVRDGHVLVDGAVLNNFPVDIMRDMHRGFIVGCDVARPQNTFPADEFIDPPGFSGWVYKNGFSRTPPIASLLMRAATVNVNPSAGRELTDVLIAPEIGDLELRDWESYDAAVDDGYQSAMKTFERCEHLFTGRGARLIAAE
ncbi:MAG: patatin-like phospholipase family protein, partial [Pseudomonadota bacterium]